MRTDRIIALIGAKGMLAQKVIELSDPSDQLVLLDLPEFDISERTAVIKTSQQINPDVIMNCAAYTQVDKCEEEEVLALRVNGAGPGFLAEAAKACGAVLVHISTDYVFPGDADEPYDEEALTGPLSAYGRTKLAGELAIIASGCEQYFIIRTSWLYGPGGPNFVETILRLSREREELRIVSDQIGSPTYSGDLAQAIFDLLKVSTQDGKSVFGVYHFSNQGQCSWYEFAQEIVLQSKLFGAKVVTRSIQPITTDEYPLPAVRPTYSVFNKTKFQDCVGSDIPQWQDGLTRYMKERQVIN
jgi:dTDP-4-dehydrorhamnose reductase